LPYGFYGTFRSAVFSIHFPCSFAPILSSGDATGLRGTFPGHPRPFHLTFTNIHNNIYTPMSALPDGTRTRADLAVVAERVLILPSTTLPSAPRRHTHTSMARRRFLPLKKSSPCGPTSIGTATSEYFLRQPCGHRATLHFITLIPHLRARVLYLLGFLAKGKQTAARY
jgi:hypothetical protein